MHDMALRLRHILFFMIFLDPFVMFVMPLKQISVVPRIIFRPLQSVSVVQLCTKERRCLWTHSPLYAAYERGKSANSDGGRGRSSVQNSAGRRGMSSSSGKAIGKTETLGGSVVGVRLNKCLPGLSRRAADDAIAEGRVTVNNIAPSAGTKVSSKDVVKLDGRVQQWQGIQVAKQQQPQRVLENRAFVYLKYYKGRGVTCTSDINDKSNIIKAGRFDLFPQRLFTVGRLDKVLYCDK